MHLNHLQNTNHAVFKKVAIEFITEKLLNPAAKNANSVLKAGVEALGSFLGQGRASHDNDMKVRPKQKGDTLSGALLSFDAPGSEISETMNMGAPISRVVGKIVELSADYMVHPGFKLAHPTISHIVTGLGGIPKKLAPHLAEYLFETKPILPFITESLGLHDFHERIQVPMYQWVSKADAKVFDTIGIGLTKRLTSQGTSTGPDPGGPQSVQDDKKAVTLGNSKLSGFAMQKLYQVVTGNINAARLQTLKSDEATEENLEQLESYATGCLQGCSLLTRFWKFDKSLAVEWTLFWKHLTVLHSKAPALRPVLML